MVNTSYANFKFKDRENIGPPPPHHPTPPVSTTTFPIFLSLIPYPTFISL